MTINIPNINLQIHPTRHINEIQDISLTQLTIHILSTQATAKIRSIAPAEEDKQVTQYIPQPHSPAARDSGDKLEVGIADFIWTGARIANASGEKIGLLRKKENYI